MHYLPIAEVEPTPYMYVIIFLTLVERGFLKFIRCKAAQVHWKYLSLPLPKVVRTFRANPALACAALAESCYPSKEIHLQ